MNDILNHRNLVRERIEKSFSDSGLIVQDIEKAHKDGDIHPSGKYVWVSSANKGKGDWRTINGRIHKNNQSVSTQSGVNLSLNQGASVVAKKPNSGSISKKSDPRNSIAQNAGFFDYAEMNAFQDYVNSKNLLKMRSMQTKTKEKERNEIQAKIDKYEEDHADVIDRIDAANKLRNRIKRNNGNDVVGLHLNAREIRVLKSYGITKETKLSDAEDLLKFKKTSSADNISNTSIKKTIVKQPKQSAFVKKTLEKIKDFKRHGSPISDDQKRKLEEAISKDEENAKKIMGIKFPILGSMGQFSSYSSKTTEILLNNGKKLIVSADKSVDTNSRYAGFRGTTSSHYGIRLQSNGQSKSLGYSSSGNWSYKGSKPLTSAKAKSECILEALLNYYDI